MMGVQILSTGMPDKREIHRSLQKCESTVLNFFISPLLHLKLIGGFYVFGNFVDLWLRVCSIAW